MADKDRTVGDLYRAKDIDDAALEAATEAVISGDAKATAWPLMKGETVDLVAAARAHAPAAAALDDARPEQDGYRRNVVRSAIVLAKVKG